MREPRSDRRTAERVTNIDHAQRIKDEYTALLAALRKAGWSDCPPDCTCRGKLA